MLNLRHNYIKPIYLQSSSNASFSSVCVLKISLAIKEKHMIRLKCMIRILLYAEFLGIICHSLLYFALLTYINEL